MASASSFHGLHASAVRLTTPLASRAMLPKVSSPRTFFPRSILSSRPQYSSNSGFINQQSSPLKSSHHLRPFSFASFRQLANPRSPLSRSPVFQTASTRSIGNGAISNGQLAHLEQTANGNPGNAAAQNGFYSALLRANMPDILVERYETGRYATNPACDAMYYRALERVAQNQNSSGSVASAKFGPTAQTFGAVTRAVSAVQSDAMNGGAKVTQTGTGAKSNPIYVTIDESRRAFVWKVVRFLIAFAFTTYFTMLIIGLLVEVSGVFRRGPGSQRSEVKAADQKTKFKDVKGCEEAIEEMQELVEFLKHPEKFNTLGGKPPKGVLMVGPPGTGKTLLARAVAGEAGVPFFYAAGSEFDEMYVGVGAKRIRELFAKAKAKAPAIIFIDEVDAVGGKRNDRDSHYHMQTLNQLLTELDGFEQGSGVIIIGATNFPKMLDKALTRPGRFDRQVVVDLPDVRGRMEILKYYMANMQFGPGIDTSLIARGTPGFSGADIENLVNQAAVHAGKNNAKTINMIDLEWARDRILMGAQKKSMVIQDKDKLMTAYHEAGHALMGHFNDAANPLYKITILPRGQALGVTHFMPDMDKVSMSKREMLAQIDVSMGGKVAEELIYGDENVTSGCSSDLLNATNIAYSMVTSYGMSETLGSIAFDNDSYNFLSTETKHKVEAEVRRILDESMERTRSMLKSKRNELELLARALIKHETLTKEEMAMVLKGETLPGVPSMSPPTSTDISGIPIKIPEMVLPPTTVGGGGSGTESKDPAGGTQMSPPPTTGSKDGAQG